MSSELLKKYVLIHFYICEYPKQIVQQVNYFICDVCVMFTMLFSRVSKPKTINKTPPPRPLPPRPPPPKLLPSSFSKSNSSKSLLRGDREIQLHKRTPLKRPTSRTSKVVSKMRPKGGGGGELQRGCHLPSLIVRLKYSSKLLSQFNKI